MTEQNDMTEDSKKRRDRIVAVFTDATSEASTKLNGKKVEYKPPAAGRLNPAAFHVVVNVDDGKDIIMIFTINRDGSIGGPDYAAGAGNIDDDDAKNHIADGIVNEADRRSKGAV
jgi:hypothetical protein